MADTSQTYGVAHFWGLRGTVAYMTVQSDDISQSFKIDAEVTDETGKIITDRLDDRFKEITIEGVLKESATLPDIGDQFTWNSVNYIVKSIDDRGSNKDFRKVSVKGVKYQEIA